MLPFLRVAKHSHKVGLNTGRLLEVFLRQRQVGLPVGKLRRWNVQHFIQGLAQPQREGERKQARGLG